MRGVLALAMMMPGAALAWERLDDRGIEALLAGREIRFDDWTRQTFRADGRTEYLTERYAEGRWRAEDGRYCSQWPPAAEWTCYDLEREGLQVRFTDDAGVASVGTLVE